MLLAEQSGRIGEVPVNTDLPVHSAWDIAGRHLRPVDGAGGPARALREGLTSRNEGQGVGPRLTLSQLAGTSTSIGLPVDVVEICGDDHMKAPPGGETSAIVVSGLGLEACAGLRLGVVGRAPDR